LQRVGGLGEAQPAVAAEQPQQEPGGVGGGEVGVEVVVPVGAPGGEGAGRSHPNRKAAMDARSAPGERWWAGRGGAGIPPDGAAGPPGPRFRSPGGPARGMLFGMSDVTQILHAIEAGDPKAAAELLPLVYDELRKLAAARMGQEKPGHTL